ncbi:FAD-dependent pyridine nucleotide-disulfide oxidoreductase [Colletotrichum plurivorum]|uniref:FAD-dependent pyridine nucleotide-disulfide oxidoreductase n=1 Tax=Colletotrichum plurivorum TaxID=2175906 RepID=A0A8H6KUU5_9PEZI|nr:FAD-dependent pyridine nucleotide-disulfide oxidoreductase [Colletotrichum plurivorum]
MAPEHYDAIIIGSGQSGTPLASALAAANLKTAVVDRAHIGDHDRLGQAAYTARLGGVYGVNGGSNVAVDMQKVRQRKRSIVESWSKGGEERLVKNGVHVIKGEASFAGPKELLVRCTDGAERSLTAETIFINTGERPSRPDIPGLDDVARERVLDSTSVMELGKFPRTWSWSAAATSVSSSVSSSGGSGQM